MNLFCFTYITCKLCSSLCMKYIWSVHNRRELWNSLFMSTLIFHLKRKIYISILQTISSKSLFPIRRFQEQMSNSSCDIFHCTVKLSIYLRPNFLKVNTRSRQKWTQIFKYSNDTRFMWAIHLIKITWEQSLMSQGHTAMIMLIVFAENNAIL